MTCSACQANLTNDARYCSACGCAVQHLSPFTAVRQRLERPRDTRMIAGVCAGFARTYGFDLTLLRLVMVAAVLLGCGVPVLLYLVAWVVMPNGPYLLQPFAGAPLQPR